MSARLNAHLALFIVALIYGANYLIAKGVMNGGYLTPSAFIWLRVTGATLLFFLLDGQIRGATPIEKKDIPRLLLSGLFGVALNQLLFFMGLERTSPINASIIMITTPIIVLITSAVLIQERVRKIQIIGVLLGASGALFLLLSKGEVHLKEGTQFGDFLILLNAISYAIYLVIVKKIMRKYRTLSVIKWIFLIGWVYVSVVAIPDIIHTSWHIMPGKIVLSISYVILCTTFAAYLLTAWAIRHLSPNVIGVYIYLQPVFATFFSYLILGEIIHAPQLISALVIGIGVYLVGMKST